MYRCLAFIILMTGLVGCGGGGGENGGGSQGPVTVQGYVKDLTTGKGIPRAQVKVGGKTGITDGNGFYQIPNVAPGTQSLWASASGYRPYPDNDFITVPDTSPFQLHDILLSPSTGGDIPPPPPF